MKKHTILSITLGLFTLLAFTILPGAISKKEAQTRVKAWYKAHPKNYVVNIKDKQAKVKITRYHTDRPEEKDDLIRINWKGMVTTLTFSKPLREFEWSETSLQSEFMFVALDQIYTNIHTPGWQVYPRTPVSSTGEGVSFKGSTKNRLVVSIDWEMYTVFGYATNKKCQEELEIMDGTIPEECYVGIRKTLPLVVKINLPLQK